MMQMGEISIPYYENDLIQMVELPYVGEELSMIVILPTSSG